MLGLPKSTEVNRVIPKTKFYDNLDVSARLKRHFIDEIEKIRWRNKISQDTMNISDGGQVHEIEVIEIELSGDSIDESVLTQIDREIPYHILFILGNGNKFKLCIGYKEKTQAGDKTFKVMKYFYSEWCNVDQISIKINASDLDDAYDKLVRKIAGETLSADSSIEQGIKIIEQNEIVEKQIARLEKQLKTEKQLNKQMEMHNEIERLRGESIVFN